MNDARLARSISPSSLVEQWNAIAPLRHQQITSRTDLSYHHVLVPTLLELAGNLEGKLILDAGCGTGHLCSLIAQHNTAVIGIDPSLKSVQIARGFVGSATNIEFKNQTIENHAESQSERYDLILCNMVLMDCSNLEYTIKSIGKLLRPSASLVATITHPWFWPQYWKYHAESWFNYAKEIPVDAPLVISQDQSTTRRTVHFHRPLFQYFGALKSAHLDIQDIREPLPPVEVHKQYPVPWEFPRFLAFAAQKPSRK